MFNIAIFASGAGSNAEKIIDYFRSSPLGKVRVVVSNRKSAGVLSIAEKNQIASVVLDKSDFQAPAEKLLAALEEREVDFIVLAGFLLKIPEDVVKRFSGNIVNIHPALLPDFGGQGMYGDHVHRAVLESGRAVSGITIHYVDNVFDNGEILFQEEIPIEKGETIDSLRAKIHKLEHYHYPRTIERILKIKES